MFGFTKSRCVDFPGSALLVMLLLLLEGGTKWDKYFLSLEMNELFLVLFVLTYSNLFLSN